MGGHGSEKGAKKVGEVLAALRFLIEQFPHCFAWNVHRPLKISIHKDLEARGIDARVARLGLHRYCRHLAYQHALVEGAIRIDLDGQPAGTVTHQEAAYAAKKDDLLHAGQIAANGRAPCIDTILKAAVAAGTLSDAACAAHARLSDQLEHLKRRVALLDIRTRGQTERETRALLGRVRNLEREVSQLRQKMKVTS